ncbi:MAG: succinylglutamate desuccinylase/aspartoacylase family protein [Nanoarchaeota archaeon]
MKIAIVCCLHGNEKYGLEVLKGLPSAFSFFIGNKRAMIENKRFIDSDLNRCFPGKPHGNYEEKRAFELVKSLKDFDYVIDLHSSSNNCSLFGIITKPNTEKIEFAKRLGLKRLVIMPKNFASGQALIDFTKCGISLEIGPHKNKDNVRKVSEKIKNLLENKGKNNNLEIFEVFGKLIKKYDKVLINNFDFVKMGQPITENFEGDRQFAEFDFVAILVDEESYGNVLCLVGKQVNLKVMKD